MSLLTALDNIFLYPGRFSKFFFWNRFVRKYVHWLFWHYLPIDSRRVLLKDKTNDYRCNPRAIAEYLAESPEGESYDIWMAVDVIPNHSYNSRIHFVEYNSISFFYCCHTAHFLIYNDGFWIQEPKRPNQILIETLHGPLGLKRVGLDGQNWESYRRIFKKAAADTDLALSPGKSFTEIIIKKAYNYKGEVLEYGTPRNDVLFKGKETIEKYKQNLRIRFNLPADARLLLYAPTFRADFGQAKKDRVYEFDGARVIEALQSRFGGKWYLIVHVHPLLKSVYRSLYNFGDCDFIDGSQIEDVQDILLGIDALLTDYSSVEMDFMLMKKPIFQYCRDWKNYDRGFYCNPQDLPFPFADNNELLIKNILNFDEPVYLQKLISYQSQIGLREEGVASKALAEWMAKH